MPPSRRKGRPATDEDRACSIEVALSDNDEDCMDFSLYGHRNKKEADESSTEPQRCRRWHCRFENELLVRLYCRVHGDNLMKP